MGKQRVQHIYPITAYTMPYGDFSIVVVFVGRLFCFVVFCVRFWFLFVFACLFVFVVRLFLFVNYMRSL